MSEMKICSSCGAELTNDAPSGLCVPCTLRKVLEPPSEALTESDAPSQQGRGSAAQNGHVAGPDPSPKESAPLSFPSAERPGGRIGPYKLIEQLGEGGCGIVYLAEQEHPVRRRVALKVIKPGMDSKEFLARFEAERQALALMDHPNIAKVLEAGATENGRPYFVMEWVKGSRITQHCDTARLSTRERLHLFVQVCHAIQHAHQKGIIHRDIKPSNVMVSMQDGVAVPKVIDFGIAKATTGQPLTDKTIFTAFEQFIGTPAYMSPEQAAGNWLDVDTRTDIYALGVLLYELLTGKTPFDTKRLLARGLEEIRRIIREEEPPRPSTKLSTLDPSEQTEIASRRQAEAPKLLGAIRGDLDWIVMKSLEKERARRYESASGLGLEIERFLHDEPVTARPPTKLYRLQKLARRNKVAVTAALTVTAALVLGLGLSTWLFVQERTALKKETLARERATTAEQKARKESSTRQQFAQFLQDMLQGVGPSVALGRDTTLLREILDKTASRIPTDLKDQSEVATLLRITLGTVYLEAAEYPKAETMFREAIAAQRALPPNDRSSLATCLSDLAVVLGMQSKLVEAEASIKEAVAMHSQLPGNDNREWARELNALGVALRDRGKLAEAAQALSDAVALLKKQYPDGSLDLAVALHELGFVFRDQGNFADAQHLIQEAIDMRNKIAPDGGPDMIKFQNSLAIVLRDQGYSAQAEGIYRAAMTNALKVFGPTHPYIAALLNNISSVLCDQSKPAEAEVLSRQALEIQRKSSTNENLSLTTCLNNLGATLRNQGKLPEAEAIFQESLDIRRRLLGAEHSSLVYSLRLLAEVVRKQDKLPQAELLIGEALAMQEKLLPETHPDLGNALSEYADILIDQEKFAEAEVPARRSLALGEKHRPEHWRTFNARSLVGASLLGQKNYTEAEPLLLSAWDGIKSRLTKIQADGQVSARNALKRISQLYEATSQPEKAGQWKAQLETFEREIRAASGISSK
jgi:serine/threonine protein kinase/tetratricopeptide (TPR) repeat protein